MEWYLIVVIRDDAAIEAAQRAGAQGGAAIAKKTGLQVAPCSRTN